MKGQKLLSCLSFINPKYIQEAEMNRLDEADKKHLPRRNSLKTLMLIAAVLATATILMGAMAYTRWSNSMQRRYNPTEDIKLQAEKTGLSVLYADATPEDGSILSATDQGITVSVVQSMVNSIGAEIVLKIEGFTYPEDILTRPYFTMPFRRLDGDEHFWGSFGYDFDDGIIRNEAGEDVYEDGTPVERVSEGWAAGWTKGRYIKKDGSMELTLYFSFQDISGSCLGKELELNFTGFGTTTAIGGKTLSDDKILVEGNWNLRFPLKGEDSSATIQITPNYRLSDNVTLLEAEIGRTSVKARYKLDTQWDGWKELELLEPQFSGVKLKDGTVIYFVPAGGNYGQMDNLIAEEQFTAFQGIVDLTQVESLVYPLHWEYDERGREINTTYQYVPITPIS